MVVYDITDRESFKAVENWIAEIDKFASPHVNRILVGNKSDLNSERQITYEEGQVLLKINSKELARAHKIKFLETSAKSSQNVHECFKMTTEEIMERVINKQMVKKEIPSIRNLSLSKVIL